MIRTLKAFIDGDLSKRRDVKVWFTSDNAGETISVQYGSRIITMKYGEIEKMVKRERDMHYTDSHMIIDEDPYYIPVDWLEEQPDLEKYQEILERWQKHAEQRWTE